MLTNGDSACIPAILDAQARLRALRTEHLRHPLVPLYSLCRHKSTNTDAALRTQARRERADEYACTRRDAASAVSALAACARNLVPRRALVVSRLRRARPPHPRSPHSGCAIGVHQAGEHSALLVALEYLNSGTAREH